MSSPESTVDLSAVICTRNRSADVDRALRSLHPELTAERDDGQTLEVIVVDNGSTDDTAAVVARHADQVPGICYELEPTLGLSSARNRGMAVARGRYLVYLDDDATVRPGWAAALLDAFARGDVVAVAGRIILAWPNGEAPAWFSTRMNGWFTQLDLGDEPIVLPTGDNPWGANMAVTTAVAVQTGGFDVTLGRVGASLLSGEEDEFFRRVRRHAPDQRFVYAPGATVDHHVQPERVSLVWVARRAFANGRSMVIADGLDQRDTVATTHLRLGIRSVGRAFAGGWGRARRRRHDAPTTWAAVAAEFTDRCQPLGAGVHHLRLAGKRISGSRGGAARR